MSVSQMKTAPLLLDLEHLSLPGKLRKSLKISLELFPLHTDKKFIHFSFIFRRNKLLSIGTNQPRNFSPKVLRLANRYGVEGFKKWPAIHSEIDALQKLIGKVHIGPELDMVNVRLSSSGLLLSKPCERCSPILDAFGIRVTWSTSSGFENDTKRAN